MASPLLPASLPPSLTTPHSTTVASPTPPSPSAVAAATALAALSSSRPPTSHGEDEDTLDDLDHDDTGGISLADLQHFVEASPGPYAMDDPPEDAIGQLQSFTAHFPFWQSTAQTSAFDTYDPVMSSFMPTSTTFISHSEHSLEPPPTLQEAHLSIQDKGSFLPITSFFHYITPRVPIVPGLDLIDPPKSITRDDLNGDHCDYQGIDWAVRNTERRYIRMKRGEFEREKLRKTRGYVPTVCTPALHFLLPLILYRTLASRTIMTTSSNFAGIIPLIVHSFPTSNSGMYWQPLRGTMSSMRLDIESFVLMPKVHQLTLLWT